MVDFRNKVDRVLKHSMKEFGREFDFYPSSGGVYRIRAIFDNDYQMVDPDTEQVVSANQSALGVNLNDFSFDVRTGDRVIVDSIMYRIIDKREDGQGGATLLLHKLNAANKVKDTKANPRNP